MDMLETSPLPLPLSIHHMNQANTSSSTPYMSAASSPQRSHARAHAHTRPNLDIFFYSAPTSPRSHATHCSFFDDLDHDDDDYPSENVPLLGHNSCTAVPFAWELKPGVPRAINHQIHHHDDQDHDEDQEEMNDDEETRKEENGEDFQFDFSGQLDMMVRPSLSSADELFHGGKIRPLKLKPPPSLQIHHENTKSSDFFHSPRSPKSPKSAMSKFKDALSMSPKNRRNGSGFGPGRDPFEAAIDEVQNRERGRDRVRPNISVNKNMNNINRRGNNNNSRKGISRSLSPLRVSEFALLQNQDPRNPTEPGNSITGLFGRGSGNATCSKKWRLKDLFLFRSASEGHYKDTQSYSKRWSFRSSSIVSGSGSGSRSGSGSESGSVSKRRGQGPSPTHEMIYSKNRIVAEELKKKTTLPYRHGLLACLGFSPVLPQFSYAFPNTPPS